MRLLIKQKIERSRQKLEAAENPGLRAELEIEIKALEDCLKNQHVYTEFHFKENGKWKNNYFCHYCGKKKPHRSK